MDRFCAAGLWEANILWNLPHVSVQAHTYTHTHTHRLHPLPVRLSCCSCCYGCSLRNIVAPHVGRDIIHGGKTKKEVGLGWCGLGWVGGARVLLQGSKMQQSRVLHHPINYSHCTVYMTHMLRKISRGCGEHGNRLKRRGGGGRNRTMLQSTLLLTIKVIIFAWAPSPHQLPPSTREIIYRGGGTFFCSFMKYYSRKWPTERRPPAPRDSQLVGRAMTDKSDPL